MAHSRHAQCADECPLLGVKRTLTAAYQSRFMSNAVAVYATKTMEICGALYAGLGVRLEVMIRGSLPIHGLRSAI
jgi:hypothetical protein